MAQQRKRKNDTGIVILASVAILVVVIAGIILGGGAYVASRDTVFPHVTVAGVDVGGMTYDEARSTLLGASVGVPTGIQATAVLTGTQSVTVTSDEAGLTVPITEAVDMAYAYGREDGFFKNLGTFVSCLSHGHEVYALQNLNEDGVRAKIAQAARLVNHGAKEPSYEVSQTELFITVGSSGYTVDEEAVFQFIKETLASGTSRSTDAFSEARSTGGTVEKPDLEAIYNEVYTEPQDAYFDAESGEVRAAVTGISFDVAAAQALLDAAGNGETIRVPLIFTEPENGSGEVNDLLFKDKLAEKDTTLATSSANRITNITLAAAAINGTVLNPGDRFSYNGTIGQRTEAKGYKPAGAYAGGGHVSEVGGGICQLSSTLYFCTLKADLKIVERQNHGYTVAYLPASLDATVNWPNLDFKFENNRNFPIKLVAWVENKRLYVEIWGTKENDYTVQLESKTLSTISPKVVEKIDETLAPGERVVDENGQYGLVSEAYKLIYDGNGNLLSRTLISHDTYRAMDKVVRVGPEASTPVGGETTDPGGETTDPGGETTNPGGETTNPGGETTNPGGETTNPGGETTNPGGETENPGGETENPGGETGNPGEGQTQEEDDGEMGDPTEGGGAAG